MASLIMSLSGDSMTKLKFQQKPRDYRQLFAGQHLPLAFVDLDLVDKNAQDLLDRAGGVPIRIASKSVRCVQVIRHVLEHHKGFQGIPAYSAGEASYLADSGFDDIVVAYPTVDRQDLLDVAAVLQRGKYVCLMVDHVDQLDVLEGIAKEKTSSFLWHSTSIFPVNFLFYTLVFSAPLCGM